MTGNENANESISKSYRWPCTCGGRKSNTFWGVLFIIVGLFWLGKKADWFSPELIAMFWPLVLIIIGIWIIGAAVIKRK
jgi:hypothetical protein